MWCFICYLIPDTRSSILPNPESAKNGSLAKGSLPSDGITKDRVNKCGVTHIHARHAEALHHLVCHPVEFIKRTLPCELTPKMTSRLSSVISYN